MVFWAVANDRVNDGSIRGEGITVDDVFDLWWETNQRRLQLQVPRRCNSGGHIDACKLKIIKAQDILRTEMGHGVLYVQPQSCHSTQLCMHSYPLKASSSLLPAGGAVFCESSLLGCEASASALPNLEPKWHTWQARHEYQFQLFPYHSHVQKKVSELEDTIHLTALWVLNVSERPTW